MGSEYIEDVIPIQNLAPLVHRNQPVRIAVERKSRMGTMRLYCFAKMLRMC
ncbi:hypothetical protein D3C85_1916480 [compost metagenome]